MTFAENNRISQRQLRRQMILAYLGPLFLCLPGKGGLQGKEGVTALVLTFAVLVFYLVFLMRLYPIFGNLQKGAGAFWGRVLGFYFTAYAVFTAAILLSVLEEVLSLGFLIGVPRWQIGGLAAMVCSVGIHKGIQRRGRMAEVTCGLLLVGVVAMLIFSLKEGKTEFLQPMLAGRIHTGAVLRQWYGCLCGFAGLSLLPFSMGNVEKRGQAGKSAAVALGVLFLILAAVLLLMPAVLGWERVQEEMYPILPLLSGTNLPGEVLARFDVIWMCLLLFSLLFSIGSLFFYGSHILQSAGLGTGRFWLAALAFFLSMDWIPRWSVRGFYTDYLKYIFVPGTILVHLFFVIKNQQKRKLGAILALFTSLLFGGCAGVEPEQRLYPLALGADYKEDGGWRVSYGMANLAEKTGQGKEEEGGSESVLTLTGSDFEEIRRFYNQSQEKYLDLGHLQVLLLGPGALEEGAFDGILMHLLEEPMTGEDLYVFRCEDVDAVMRFQKAAEGSVGDYLKGIYENRAWKREDKGVTLRECYAHWYRDKSWRELPEIRMEEGEVVILEKGEWIG